MISAMEIKGAVLPIVGYNLGTLIFMLLPKQLLLFSADDTLLAVGVSALRIISVTFIFSSLTTVLGYSASGLGNSVISMRRLYMRVAHK